MQEKLNILGFMIDKIALYRSSLKVYAMVNSPKRKNFKQLVPFLCLITFYARCLESHYITVTDAHVCNTSCKVSPR